MPTHKEFTAWITVDGRQLPEYNTNVEENGRKVACYIPSEPGAKFSVHWRDNGSKTFTAAYIQLDGFTTPGRYLGGEGEQMRSGVRSGPETERPFVFADIPKTTSRNVSNAPNPKQVGTIVLKIMQAQRGPPRPADKFQIIPGGLSREWIETTGGHCATFAKEEVKCDLQAPYTWTSSPIDPDDSHSYVKFIFHYRTMGWLVEHHIAPPDHAARTIHLGRKIQFTVTPQQYPGLPPPLPDDLPTEAKIPPEEMESAARMNALNPQDAMKAMQVNTLNPEQPPKMTKAMEKAKEREEKRQRKELEKKIKQEEEERAEANHPAKGRIRTIEELKRDILPHLLDPSIPPPPIWFEESLNQKRKRERAEREAAREAKFREEEEARRRASGASRASSSSTSQPYTSPNGKQPLSQSRSQPPSSSQSSPSSSRSPSSSQPQPQPHHQPHQRAPPQIHVPNHYRQHAQQTSTFFIPAMYAHYSQVMGNLNPAAAPAPAPALGCGRPPLANRAASSSRLVSAGGSSTRVVSSSSIRSNDSLPDYESESEPDPSPSLKRTKTMPVVPMNVSHRGTPAFPPARPSGMDFGMRRNFSTASSSSVASIPTESQSEWSSLAGYDKMDES